MKKKGLLLIILSVILGAGTFLGIYYYISKLNEQVDVVIAKVNIPPYSKIEEDMLKVEKKPKYFVPINEITSKTDYVINMYTGEFGIFEGDIICRFKVKTKDEIKDRTLVDELTDGSKAIAIKVDLVSSVAGVIKEEDYVDISIIDAEFSVTPIESIKLLAVKNSDGENIRAGVEGKTIPSVVILEALSDEIRDTVVSVIDKGQVHLSLVKPSDVKETMINEEAVEKIQEKNKKLEEAILDGEREINTHF